MKNIILTICLACTMILVLAAPASAKKTSLVTTELVNQVTAEVALPKGADNNVMVTFKRSDNSVLGALVLSPEQPSIKNFTYRLGDQKIHIQGIQLGLPVYERSMGSVVINCKISDGNGRNTERYKGMIASWPYK